MDVYILQLLVIGLLLLAVTLSSGWIPYLPLSYALIYLVFGIILSPYGVGLIQLRPDAQLLERFTEFVVIVSLFSCGLKMNRRLKIRAWRSTIRLIGILMPLSIFAIAAISHWFLAMNWGSAILLGAILAPTDPVLASEVQITHPDDQDELRFGLTSEGGLNDALAFPFVYFGLYWLKEPNWQTWIRDWILTDIVWAIALGLIAGIVVAKAVVWVEQRFRRITAIDDMLSNFIVLSIIFITYALAEIFNGYGFLAVFIAGIVTQQSYRDPDRSSAQLEFAEMIERLMEIGTILLLGSLLRLEPFARFLPQALVIAGFLLFIIRPLGAWVSTVGMQIDPIKRYLFGWFGIRGVGSLYYLYYALGEGLKDYEGERIAWITFITIIISIVTHGISSTPLMRWYEKQNSKKGVSRQAKVSEM
ncbi:MAG TPA: sodium:proton antiporter [Leptolyngbyaceae cyanobacterium M33_DOE_097]|nr:sodium:proton antiporter [Leptolyngbyaceae cyanobacterium M33_DOE_097]